MTRFFHWLLDRRVIVPGNLVRFRLFAIPGTRSWRVYLHHFIGPDPDRALHDHPKRFVSIGLRGGYTELVMVQAGKWAGRRPAVALRPHRKVWVAPWVRSFPATHIHRISGVLPGTWTLVLVGRVVREWGFWKRREVSDTRTRARLAAKGVALYEWVHWKDYHGLTG